LRNSERLFELHEIPRAVFFSNFLSLRGFSSMKNQSNPPQWLLSRSLLSLSLFMRAFTMAIWLGPRLGNTSKLLATRFGPQRSLGKVKRIRKKRSQLHNRTLQLFNLSRITL